MVHRTGYLLKTEGTERYIQVETILVFYRQEFISTGKHLLFENEMFIGNFTVKEGKYFPKGLATLSDLQKAELIVLLKALKLPSFDPRPAEFGFGIQLGDNLTYCEVILNNNLYEIWYDAQLIAKIYQDDQCKWQQVSGELLQPSIIREITDRIESHYSN